MHFIYVVINFNKSSIFLSFETLFSRNIYLTLETGGQFPGDEFRGENNQRNLCRVINFFESTYNSLYLEAVIFLKFYFVWPGSHVAGQEIRWKMLKYFSGWKSGKPINPFWS